MEILYIPKTFFGRRQNLTRFEHKIIPSANLSENETENNVSMAALDQPIGLIDPLNMQFHLLALYFGVFTFVIAMEEFPIEQLYTNHSKNELK